jgi:hypothetical protein
VVHSPTVIHRNIYLALTAKGPADAALGGGIDRLVRDEASSETFIVTRTSTHNLPRGEVLSIMDLESHDDKGRHFGYEVAGILGTMAEAQQHGWREIDAAEAAVCRSKT